MRASSKSSFNSSTVVEEVGAGGANQSKPAVAIDRGRGTASTSTSVVIQIGGYTNPMVKEGGEHLGGNNQEGKEDGKEEDQEEGQEEDQEEDQKEDQDNATGERVWSSHTDSTTGETYYHRSLDGRSTW